LKIQRCQATSFFSIFEHQYVKRFLECDTCYLISDNYLQAATFLLLLRAKIKPTFYRQFYFVALYVVTEVYEESHHKIHLLNWIKDDKDALLGLFPVGSMDDLNAVYKQLAKVRLYFVRDLLKFSILSSHETLSNIMSINLSHPIWQRTRSSAHRGKQHTIEELQHEYRDEADWILNCGGVNAERFICKEPECATADKNATRGFKVRATHKIRCKRDPMARSTSEASVVGDKRARPAPPPILAMNLGSPSEYLPTQDYHSYQDYMENSRQLVLDWLEKNSTLSGYPDTLE